MAVLFIIFVFVLIGFFLWRRFCRRRFKTDPAMIQIKSIEKGGLKFSKEPEDYLTEDEEVKAVRSIKQAKSVRHAYSKVKPDKLIVLNIMAPRGKMYQGYELIQALLSEGLRFGAMKIFHRHETKKGDGPVLFSMASVVKPGSFDLEQIGALRCPGLCCFFSIQQTLDPMEIFELMWETAGNLVEELGGKICNVKREPISDGKLLALRLKIRRLQEDRHTPDLFATEST